MIEEALAQSSHARQALVTLAYRDVQGCRQADRQRHRLGAGPSPGLLMAAKEARLQATAATHDQGADAGWSVELVGAQRQGRHAQLTEVDGNPTHRLHAIAMEGDV